MLNPPPALALSAPLPNMSLPCACSPAPPISRPNAEPFLTSHRPIPLPAHTAPTPPSSPSPRRVSSRAATSPVPLGVCLVFRPLAPNPLSLLACTPIAGRPASGCPETLSYGASPLAHRRLLAFPPSRHSSTPRTQNSVPPHPSYTTPPFLRGIPEAQLIFVPDDDFRAHSISTRQERRSKPLRRASSRQGAPASFFTPRFGIPRVTTSILPPPRVRRTSPRTPKYWVILARARGSFRVTTVHPLRIRCSITNFDLAADL
ncbi:hypothetical protein B0H10DRAFT_2437821 [Mycena sp. CBHHK59/15]|nr:hypothetical protein B0H10DRAFT_2437821 [Mycena sp. CBHHK59/15]